MLVWKSERRVVIAFAAEVLGCGFGSIVHIGGRNDACRVVVMLAIRCYSKVVLCDVFVKMFFFAARLECG